MDAPLTRIGVLADSVRIPGPSDCGVGELGVGNADYRQHQAQPRCPLRSPIDGPGPMADVGELGREDLTFFTLVWPYDSARQLVGQSGLTEWFWVHAAQAVVFTVLAILAFPRLARISASARRGENLS